MTDFVKKSSLIFLLSFLLISACKEKPKNPAAEYGDNLINSYQGSKNAADLANLDALNKGVAAYRALNEKAPASLAEIEAIVGVGRIDLTKYDYDPQSGTVSLKK